MIAAKRILSPINSDICQKCYHHTSPFTKTIVVGETPVVLFNGIIRKLLLASFNCRFNSTISDKKYISVQPEEVGKFENMSGSWWDCSRGQMKELHSMNKLRVALIRDGILQQQGNPANVSKSPSNTPKPLEGFKILDVGCGGGILCEPLGRLGATVMGIDPGKENITVAGNHLPDDLLENVTYECLSIEELASRRTGNDDSFDAIVMSEVIEHIENQESFISTATEVLKPGGSLFLTTVNRTTESWLGAIVAWEYLLRRLPVGTHHWKNFVTPQEIDRIFKSCGLHTVVIHGMCYNPLNDSWRWSNQRAINYAMHAVKC